MNNCWDIRWRCSITPIISFHLSSMIFWFLFHQALLH
jgi:hypothetical protein